MPEWLCWLQGKCHVDCHSHSHTHPKPNERSSCASPPAFPPSLAILQTGLLLRGALTSTSHFAPSSRWPISQGDNFFYSVFNGASVPKRDARCRHRPANGQWPDMTSEAQVRSLIPEPISVRLPQKDMCMHTTQPHKHVYIFISTHPVQRKIYFFPFIAVYFLAVTEGMVSIILYTMKDFKFHKLRKWKKRLDLYILWIIYNSVQPKGMRSE